MTASLERIAIIGGSAISKIIGSNVKHWPELFHSRVNMWVFEEIYEGRGLIDWINHSHINPKYLPGIELPSNVVAVGDLLQAVQDCSLLVFVLPHQFVKKTCQALQGHILPTARGVSLIKGMDIGAQGGLSLVSETIATLLSIPMCVLMGANIANEVAQGQFCETTLGYARPEDARVWRAVFDAPCFRVSAVEDIKGVELCGALKNVVAIAAGVVDGLGLGENTKAAVIRIGLVEMKRFSDVFCSVSENRDGRYESATTQWETYFESCGVADLITTCFGGRNRRLAEAHVKTGKGFEQLESELLNGQKLQGPLTSKEIYSVLVQKNQTKKFPLFTAVYRICYEGMPALQLIECLSTWSDDHCSSHGLCSGQTRRDGA